MGILASQPTSQPRSRKQRDDRQKFDFVSIGSARQVFSIPTFHSNMELSAISILLCISLIKHNLNVEKCPCYFLDR